MAISQALLQEFDREMATTRKMLERFPEDKTEWRPHETCMTLGRLAGHVAELAGWTTVTYMKPWTFVARGQTVFTMPKVAVLRSFVMNHMIHHRGQLAAFYRIAGVPVPSIYGPSKDEQIF